MRQGECICQISWHFGVRISARLRSLWLLNAFRFLRHRGKLFAWFVCSLICVFVFSQILICERVSILLLLTFVNFNLLCLRCISHHLGYILTSCSCKRSLARTTCRSTASHSTCISFYVYTVWTDGVNRRFTNACAHCRWPWRFLRKGSLAYIRLRFGLAPVLAANTTVLIVNALLDAYFTCSHINRGVFGCRACHIIRINILRFDLHNFLSCVHVWCLSDWAEWVLEDCDGHSLGRSHTFSIIFNVPTFTRWALLRRICHRHAHWLVWGRANPRVQILLPFSYLRAHLR